MDEAVKDAFQALLRHTKWFAEKEGLTLSMQNRFAGTFSYRKRPIKDITLKTDASCVVFDQKFHITRRRWMLISSPKGVNVPCNVAMILQLKIAVNVGLDISVPNVTILLSVVETERFKLYFDWNV